MNITKQNPYVGPRTFETNEGDLFFGREREALDLFSLVVSERLVLFYAQSGAGKSSLINTKLKPALAEEGEYDVLPIGRVIGETSGGLEINNIYIYNLIKHLVHRDIEEVLLSKLTLSDFLQGMEVDDNNLYFYNVSPQPKLSGSDDAVTKKNVLIIDQFEELFTTHHEAWEKREDFFKQLAQATQDFPNLWVVLVMREDYIAYLDPYVHLLPGRLRVRYYMQRLGREAAIEAVEGPARKSGRSYAKEVAKRLVDDLSGIKVQKPDGSSDVKPGQYVEPVQLQVVCFSLWDNLSSDGTQITEKDLQEVGDVNQSLEKHYARRVKEVAELKGVNERTIRKWFGKKLITSGGIRNMILRDPNKRDGELDDDVIQALQSDLVRAEKRGGVIFYELTHDRLVEPIIANNKKWEEENLSPLQRQAALWSDQDQNETWLLIDQALAEVEQWAKDHVDEITEIENEFLDACRKHQSQVDERRESQRRELKMAQDLAKEQERLADEQRKSAEQARRFADEQERYAQEQLRSAKRARLLTIIAFSLFALAIMASIFAVSRSKAAENSAATAAINEKKAKTAKADADDLAKTARARELASRIDNSGSLDLSMLLSVEAYDVTAENREAQSAIFNYGQISSRLRGFLANSINPASQFRFSPDGKFLAAVKEDDNKKKNLVLWNLKEDLQEGQVLDDSGVNQFFFSPDSSFLFYLNQDGINTWDLIKNEKKAPINAHVGEVSQIIFNPDGTSFATLGENGNLIQWDAKTAEPVKSLSRGDVIAFSPDGGKFALFKLDKITIGSIASNGQQLPLITKDPYSVTSMAFSQDGKLLAIAEKDGSISFWELDWKNLSNKDTGTVFSTEVPIEKLAFLPNGNLVIYFKNPPDAKNINEIRILDGKSGRQVGNAISETLYKLSPDGGTLATFDSSFNINLYATETGKKNNSNPLQATLAEFSWDGKSLAIFNKDNNKISLVNTSKGTQSSELAQQTPDGTVPSLTVSMAFSRDGSQLAAGFEDGSITIWDLNKQTNRTDPLSSKSSVASLAFSPNGMQLIAGRKDSTVSVWNLSEAKSNILKRTEYPGRINSMGLSPDEKFLYSIARNSVALFNVESRDAIGKTLRGDHLQFIADNKIMAVFDIEDNIILWDTLSRKQIPEAIKGEFVQFSPKGRVLETKDKDGKITLWNTLTGAKIIETQEKNVIFSPNEKFAIAFNESNLISLFMDVSKIENNQKLVGKIYKGVSPNDEILLTSNIPGQLELWNTSTGELQGKPIKVSKDQRYPPYFSPSGNILVTSGNDTPGKLDVWNTATGAPLGELVNSDQVIIINEDETRLITRSDSINAYTLWDLTSLKKINDALPGGFNTISFDGQAFVMNDYYSISFWDINNGKLIGEPILSYGSTAVFSADSKTMLAFSYYGDAILWDMVNMKPIGEPIPGAYLDITSDFKMLAMRSNFGEITLWDTTSGKQIGGPIRGTSRSIGITTFNPKGYINAVRNEGNTSAETTIKLQSNDPTKYFDPQSTDALIISPDKQTFAIFSPDGSLTLWDISTPSKPEKDVKDFKDAITSTLLSPDGGTLALAASSKDVIDLWNTASGKLLGNLPNNHIKEASDLYLSPDNKTLVINNNKDLSVWWNISDKGKQIRPDQIHGAFCGFSPDGKILITATSAFTSTYSASSAYSYISYCYPTSSLSSYSLWDTSTGKKIGDSLLGSYSYSTFSFTRDSQFMMFQPYGASSFKILKIVKDPQSVELVQIGEPISGTFQSFTADGRFVISSDNDGIKLWDIVKEKRGNGIIIPGSLMIVSSDGKNALFSSYDYGSYKYTYYLWNLENTPRQIDSIDNMIDYPVTSPNGTFMAGSTEKGVFKVWNLTNGTSKPIGGRPSMFSPDNQFIAVVDDSGVTPDTTIWNTNKAEKVSGPFKGSIWGFNGPYSNVVAFRDDKEGGFILYDTLSGTPINKSAIIGDGLMFNPAVKIFASYTYGGEIYLWHSDTAVQIGKTIPGQLIGFSADGETLVTTETNENEGVSEISLWNTSNGEQRGSTFTYPGSLTGIRVNEGRTLLSAFGNEGAFIWDLTKPDAPPAPIVDATAEARQMAFSPDGKILATVGSDGIILWDAVNRKKISALLIGSTGRITDIGFSQDSKTLVYLDSDGSVFKLAIADAAIPPKDPIKKFDNACRMSLSPHGEYLAYKSGKKLHLWNIDGIKEFPDLGENLNISCSGPMTFSENGSSLAYSENNHIYIYTFDGTGKVIKKVELTGDIKSFNYVYNLTFVLDDNILAVTGDDSRISFWDIKARTMLGKLDQPGSATRYANGKLQIYLPSERRLTEINFEDSAWQNLLNKWKDDLCSKAGRFLTSDEWQQYFPDLPEPDPKSFNCPMPGVQPLPTAP